MASTVTGRYMAMNGQWARQSKNRKTNTCSYRSFSNGHSFRILQVTRECPFDGMSARITAFFRSPEEWRDHLEATSLPLSTLGIKDGTNHSANRLA